MPKPAALESRSDFRGGLNSAVSPDLLNINELTVAENVRLDSQFGALAKRPGSRRIHTTVIGVGAAVLGLTQWDSPSGLEVVAIAGGRFYHKTTQFGDFTEVIPANAFSTTGPTVFAPFRSTSANAALVLFMASANGNVYQWDGTTLTQIDGVQDVPNADFLAAYHTRMFSTDIDFPKNTFFSKVGDATTFSTGGSNDGGSAIVDLLSGEAILAYAVLGSSLAMATSNSIVRFTGYSTQDIQIQQDTEGISADTGIVGPLALITAESVGFLLADRGPYLVQQEGLTPIGVKIEPTFDSLDRTVLADIALGFHHGKREVFYATTRTTDTKTGQSIFVYSLRLQSWVGPWTYPFGIRTFSRYQDSVGDEFLIAGGDDGFVRHMELGAVDDRLANDTGGSSYTMLAELAPIFFDTGPGVTKSLDHMLLQADLPATTDLRVKTSFDQAAFSDDAITGVDTPTRNYRQDLDGQGNRLIVQFSDASSDLPIINGFQLFARNMQRLLC